MPALDKKAEKSVLNFLRGKENLSHRGNVEYLSDSGKKEVTIISSDFVSFRQNRNEDLDDNPTFIEVLAFPADRQQFYTQLRPEDIRKQLEKFEGVVVFFEHIYGTHIGSVASVRFDEQGNMFARLVIHAINQQPNDYSRLIARKVLGGLISGTMKGVSVSFRKEYDPFDYDYEFARTITPLEISVVFEGRTDTKILEISLSDRTNKLDEDLFFLATMTELASKSQELNATLSQQQKAPAETVQLSASSSTTPASQMNQQQSAAPPATQESTTKEPVVELSGEASSKLSKLEKLMGAQPANPTMGDNGDVITPNSEDAVKLSVWSNIFKIDPVHYSNTPKEVKDALVSFNNEVVGPAVTFFNENTAMKTELSAVKKSDSEKTSKLGELEEVNRKIVNFGKAFLNRRNFRVEKLSDITDAFSGLVEYSSKIEKALQESNSAADSYKSQLDSLNNMQTHMNVDYYRQNQMMGGQQQVSLSAAQQQQQQMQAQQGGMKRPFSDVSHGQGDLKRQTPMIPGAENLKSNFERVQELSKFMTGYRGGSGEVQDGNAPEEVQRQTALRMTYAKTALSQVEKKTGVDPLKAYRDTVSRNPNMGLWKNTVAEKAI